MQAVTYWVQSTVVQGMYSPCTACAFVSLLDTVYNYLRDAFRSTACSILSRRQSTTIQGMMRFFSTARSVVDQIQSTIIGGTRFFGTARAVISLLGTITIIQGMIS